MAPTACPMLLKQQSTLKPPHRSRQTYRYGGRRAAGGQRRTHRNYKQIFAGHFPSPTRRQQGVLARHPSTWNQPEGGPTPPSAPAPTQCMFPVLMVGSGLRSKRCSGTTWREVRGLTRRCQLRNVPNQKDHTSLSSNSYAP